MKIKKQLVKRDIAGDVILVPVGESVYDSNGLFALNELGAFLWDKLPQAQTRDDLLEAVLAEYDVPREQAAKDLDEFLSNLKKFGII